MASEPQPKEAPSIGLPESQEICRLAIIDSKCDITVARHMLVEPQIAGAGHDWLNLPTYAFLITHQKTGAQVVFDLGAKKDWWNSVPAIAELAGNHIPGWNVEADVADILVEGGVELSKIKSFILSHWHLDHCGDLATLPPSVDLLVGPGFRETFLPGYPTKETSTFWESAFEGRNVIEVPFEDKFKIGKYQAHDYFGDGSLYILNVPGHATGHISALVRTTPDTAVFLGGDVCHFTGMVRPSEYRPIPDKVPGETKLDGHIPSMCPCAAFTICHPDQANCRTTPFYKPSTSDVSFYADPPKASESIRALAEFDADPNILIIIAHDPVPKEVLPFFPNGELNDWHQKKYKNQMFWGFFNELPYEGKVHRPPLVDGLYREGIKVRDLQGDK